MARGPVRSGLARLRENQSRYRWYALGVTTFTQAASSAVTSALGPLAPLLMAQFAISRGEVGLVQTSVYLSATWSALVGGRLADRVGERSVLIVSGLITGAGAIAAGVRRTVLGVPRRRLHRSALGTGVQNPAGSAAVMRWFPPRRRGFAMGIRQTGVPVGGVLAATLWPWVATAWGWRATYGLAGAMALFGTAVVVLSYFDPARETGPGTAVRSLRDLMTDRRLWLLSLTYNGQIVAQYSVTVYLVLFFHEALGFSLIVAAGLLALVNAVAIGGRIGWGLASDALFGGARRPVLLIIIALTFAGMLMAAALPAGAPLGAGDRACDPPRAVRVLVDGDVRHARDRAGGERVRGVGGRVGPRPRRSGLARRRAALRLSRRSHGQLPRGVAGRRARRARRVPRDARPARGLALH